MKIIPMVSTHKWHIVGYPQWLCLGTTVPISVGIIDWKSSINPRNANQRILDRFLSWTWKRGSKMSNTWPRGENQWPKTTFSWRFCHHLSWWNFVVFFPSKPSFWEWFVSSCYLWGGNNSYILIYPIFTPNTESIPTIF